MMMMMMLMVILWWWWLVRLVLAINGWWWFYWLYVMVDDDDDDDVDGDSMMMIIIWSWHCGPSESYFPVKVIGCHVIHGMTSCFRKNIWPSMGIAMLVDFKTNHSTIYSHESCNLWHEMRVYSFIFHQSRQCRTNHGSLYNQRLYIPSHIPIHTHSFVPKISGKHPPPHLRGQGRSLPGWLVVSLFLEDHDTSGGLSYLDILVSLSKFKQEI